MKTNEASTASQPHTPGPWHAAGHSVFATKERISFGGPIREYHRPIMESVNISDDGDPHYIEKYPYHMRIPGHSESEANARLIAAAPDLLDIAKKIDWLATAGAERHGVPYYIEHGDWIRLWKDAQAAIAKAEVRA